MLCINCVAVVLKCQHSGTNNGNILRGNMKKILGTETTEQTPKSAATCFVKFILFNSMRDNT